MIGPLETYQHMLERAEKLYRREGFEVARHPVGTNGRWLPLVAMPNDQREVQRLFAVALKFRGCVLNQKLYAEGMLLVPAELDD